MNIRKIARSAALALAASAWTGAAEAATSARLNINVSVTQNLSVSVNGLASSTQTVTWNAGTPNERLVSPATATVLNDSGAQTERWQLSTNASSLNTAGGAETWAVVADSMTVGPNEFALQAVFGSSNTAAGGCPAFNAASWDAAYAPELTDTPATYTSSVFADATLDAGGGTPDPDVPGNGRMRAGSFRALCWRLITPSSTDTTDTQNIQLTITAVAP